jgi:hypothetical protein
LVSKEVILDSIRRELEEMKKNRKSVSTQDAYTMTKESVISTSSNTLAQSESANDYFGSFEVQTSHQRGMLKVAIFDGL